MKIFVTAKPNAKEERVEQIDNSHFAVSVKEPPARGRANAAIVKALAEHLNVPPSQVRMISGFSSRQKVFEVQDSS